MNARIFISISPQSEPKSTRGRSQQQDLAGVIQMRSLPAPVSHDPMTSDLTRLSGVGVEAQHVAQMVSIKRVVSEIWKHLLVTGHPDERHVKKTDK